MHFSKALFCKQKKSKPTKIFDFCGVKIKDFDRFFHASIFKLANEICENYESMIRKLETFVSRITNRRFVNSKLFSFEN